jgi:hypothetical protein
MEITKSKKFPMEEKIYVNYPHYEFEIIKKGSIMTLCKHIESGKKFTVFNSLIEEDGGNFKLKTSFVNNFFDLKKGDVVEVCLVFEDCILIKYGEEFGWIMKSQVE